VFFHAGRQLKAFRADSESVYEGVVLDRTVALVDSIIVDFFRCRSDQKHQYDFSLHVDGELADCSVQLGQPQAGPLSDAPGYNNITDSRHADLNGQAELTYHNDDGKSSLHLSLLPAGEVELITAVSNKSFEDLTNAAIIIRSNAESAGFVGVMSFGGEQGERISTRPVDDLPDGILGVEITRPDGTKHIVLSAETPGTFKYAGLKITGQLALLRVSPDGSTELIDTVE